MDVSDDDGVRTVTFDRPDVLNAFTTETAERLADAISEPAPESHDAIVLTGEGPAFSAGGDIEAMADREESTAAAFDRVTETFGRLVETMLGSQVPIVAKVNGDAVGAGLAVTAASDFAYAAEHATFSCAFVRVGLVPDTGGTFLLPQLVGLRAAKRLAMTGEFFSADEAAELGLINQSVSNDELNKTVDELVETLQDRPTQTLGLTKRAFHENLGKGPGEAIDYENHVQALAYDTDAHREGVDAFLEGRDPEF